MQYCKILANKGDNLEVGSIKLSERGNPRLAWSRVQTVSRIMMNHACSNCQACQMLVRYGPPAEPSNFQLYKAGGDFHN